MYSDLLITILLVIVIVLLVLGIVIAVMILQLLGRIKRIVAFAEKIVDDIEKFGKLVNKLKIPAAWGGFLGKVLKYLPQKDRPSEAESAKQKGRDE